MKSDAGRGCGVHIHIGAKGHTPQTIRNLVNIMASHESQIAKAIKVDSWRQRSYCRTVDPRFLEQINRKKPSTMSQLADVWYESQHCECGRSHHYNDSRYHMLNLHATFTKHTIEFRLFQFDAPADGKQNGLHAGHLKAMIQLCLAMSQLAKQVRFGKPQAPADRKRSLRFPVLDASPRVHRGGNSKPRGTSSWRTWTATAQAGTVNDRDSTQKRETGTPPGGTAALWVVEEGGRYYEEKTWTPDTANRPGIPGDDHGKHGGGRSPFMNRS